MSDPTTYLWLIPILPLAASAVTALFGPRLLRNQSHWPCVLALPASCVLSILVLIAVGNGFLGTHIYATWFEAGDLKVDYALRADGLTAIMLVMITFISSFIAIYAIGYMHNDPGYPRFFAEFSLFVAFMTGLVLANNFILLYACWEGVGLCSYLLVGYWFTRPSAAAAARKAFLVTRLGDVGMFIGLLVLWFHFGHESASLEYDHVFGQIRERLEHGTLDYQVVVAISLLLLCGAVGKSAQFPLHVWLPDAMEGPTPVSALIHAATMVTAGVYLVARCTPLYALAPTAQALVAILGAITMLLAALIALTQTDLKRVLAYSTLSQLGYMFLGLGCALTNEHLHLTTFAVFAAIFHLFTHAFFKALLFMAAGSVMHAMGDVIDMRKFGGLRRVLPVTHWTFLFGAVALAGIPPFSGFWSKDEIIASAWLAGQHSVLYGVLAAMAILTVGLTAFYTGRAYFLTFWGPERIPPEAYSHAHGGHGRADVHAPHGDLPHGTAETTEAQHLVAHTGGGQVHEAPPVMTVPLMVLSVGAICVGGVLGSPTRLFEHFLEHHWMEPIFPRAILPPEHAAEHTTDLLLLCLTLVFAVGGAFLAYWMYVVQPAAAERVARGAAGAYELSRNRFYLDEIYDLLVVTPMTMLAHVLSVIDQYLVDGLVDLVGQVPGAVGQYVIRPVQNGLVQFYALLMVLGLTGIVIAVLLR